MLVKVAFWLFVFIIFYSYIGYGILLWILLKLRGPYKKSVPAEHFTLPVTLVIATYNEEAIIREKILNTLDLDYPEEI